MMTASELYSSPHLRLKAITPLYSKLDQEYQQVYSGPYNDLSVYSKGGIIYAAEKDGKITGFGRPVIAVGNDEGFLRGKIAELLEATPHIIYCCACATEGGIDGIARLLLQKGAVPRLFFTQIIDLTQSEQKLHTGIRKSYTSLINADIMRLQVFTSTSNANFGTDYIGKVMDDFKQLHIMQHIRQTRSDRTWSIQKEMIRENEAFVVALYDGEKLVAADLIYHNGASAYYAVSATSGVNTHALLWKGILTAKELGNKTFEVGEQMFPAQEKDVYGYKNSDKIVTISAYKRGFGGKTRMRLLLEM